MAIETRNSSRSSNKTSIFDDIEATRSINSTITEETSSSSTSEFLKSSDDLNLTDFAKTNEENTFEEYQVFYEGIEVRSESSFEKNVEFFRQVVFEDTITINGEAIFGENAEFLGDTTFEADLDIRGSVILTSPNGTRFRLSVDNSGNLTSTAI